MCSLYHSLLPLASLQVVCHFKEIGVNSSWPFAMDLKDLSHTGHILNSCYFMFYRHCDQRTSFYNGICQEKYAEVVPLTEALAL